jgi:two-component system, NtrC family, nitrogen regulation response regulator NtrX
MDRPRRILIVDDNGGIRALLTEALEERGYHVASAASGTAMREMLSRDRVDVVVLDVWMPGEDGHSLALHAKELRIPVVLITGSNEEIEFARTHDFQLLRKPFRMPQLFDALDTALASGIYDERGA